MDEIHAKRRFRDWSKLPGELLEEIILKIDWPEDVIRWSCVCHAWLTSFRRIRQEWRPANPWLLLTEITQDNPNCLRKVYNPGNNKCYDLGLPETFGKNCWGSDLGWIVTYGLDLELNLFNPLTKSRLELPPTDTMKPAEQLKQPASCNSNCKYNRYWMRNGHISKACVLKTKTSGLLVAVIHANVRGYGCYMIESTYLSIARPGDTMWTLVETPKEIIIKDVLVWKDLLWFVDENCSLWYVVDTSNGGGWSAVEFVVEPHGRLVSSSLTSSYLVESFDNQLLLVQRNYGITRAATTTITRRRNGIIIVEDDFCKVYDQHKKYWESSLADTVTFDVFKLDLTRKKWEEVTSDFGQSSSMFLGKNTSLLVANPKLGTCEPKSIYFAGDLNFKSGHDIGRHFLLPDGHPMYQNFDFGPHSHSNFCNPFWFTPLLY